MTDKERIEEKIQNLNKMLQERIDAINRYEDALKQLKAERLQVSGQIQALKEELEYRKDKDPELSE